MTTKLERAHAKGQHDLDPIEDCPLCQHAAQEAARLRREAEGPSRTRGSKGPRTIDPQAASWAERWRAGETLAQIVDGERHAGKNVTRSTIRRLITIAVGGKSKFNELRKAGAGGSTKKIRAAAKAAREESRTMGRNAFFIANPDDANLPVITSARRSEGWGYKRIREVSIHIAPDGTEYVYAKPNEKADLIYSFADEDHPSHGLPDVRLRKLGTSSKARKLEKEIKKAEEIKKATVARKVARRIRRKGGG